MEEAVLNVVDVVTKEHYADIVSSVQQGFTHFTYIGGGLSILSKTDLGHVPLNDIHVVSDFFRSSDVGDKTTVMLSNDRELVVYNSTINPLSGVRHFAIDSK